MNLQQAGAEAELKCFIPWEKLPCFPGMCTWGGGGKDTGEGKEKGCLVCPGYSCTELLQLGGANSCSSTAGLLGLSSVQGFSIAQLDPSRWAVQWAAARACTLATALPDPVIHVPHRDRGTQDSPTCLAHLFPGVHGVGPGGAAGRVWAPATVASWFAYTGIQHIT